jgi:hypothetical protein
MPTDKALQLPGAQKVVVTKEERGQPIEVIGVKTSKPLETFLQNTLSVVVRPTTDMQYVPDDVKETVADAVGQGKVYSVLSAWPGEETPPASKWGGKWAVIIPGQENIEKLQEVQRLSSQGLEFGHINAVLQGGHFKNVSGLASFIANNYFAKNFED